MSSSDKDSTNEYEKYMASLHANLVTPDEIIRQVVKDGSGVAMLEKHRIIAGEVSEVYRIVLENHKELILRVARSPYPNFQQELWAINAAKQVGVPVPTILLVTYLSINGEACSLCLMEKLDGEPLERGSIKFGELDPTQQQAYIHEAGEILAKIHSIKMHGFGWIIGEGKAEHETGDGLFSEWLHKEERFKEIAREHNIHIKTIERAIQLVSQLQDFYKEVTPCLNHADYGHKHFMVKGGKIVGIIDWGGVRSDSPVYDFSCWDYWFGDYIPTNWLQEGYSNREIFDDSFEDILHRRRIMMGMEILDWYSKQMYEKGVSDAIAKLYADVAFFL